MPGATGKQLRELLPGVPDGTISARLTEMVRAGELRAERVPACNGVQAHFRYYPGPVESPDRAALTTRRVIDRPPSPPGLAWQATAEQLAEEVRALKEWKAAAIARHPDLAIDPMILKARQIVAAKALERDAKATHEAELILNGTRDNALVILAVVEALEEAA